ncbi:GNAT family N-acetyltransferase [Isobaculum melis]|uniref:Ribosomal protein S18 acetylase RimI n=1 Tax=Isobaculum melis TaxID=142588 RepID=A0A1H9QV58_9LACT|nr:GNAT family N-acetyltransferase [Isobaculum melis]SER64338.1 Ribosomal protein S18 acetylase RimI [Isobaculum melis]
MEIKALDKSYLGYTWTTNYQTNGYYALNSEANTASFSFKWQKKRFEKELSKKFTSELFAEYIEQAEAFGLFSNDTLVGIVETGIESWNNRLRISSIWLHEDYRKQGFGTKLMNCAIERAERHHVRGIILETQSCNIQTIDFYLKFGFQLVGFDLFAYSNQDVENQEVRFEMMKMM